MIQPATVELFFNMRSPYCYLASKTMWSLFDDFHATLVWKCLGGWTGRSDPERAKVKLPMTRQDVSRWARRMGIPFNPPPVTTDPTPAGALSLLAEERGLLRPYVVETMRREWAEGRDIGQAEVLEEIARAVGLDPKEAIAATTDPARLERLRANGEEAAAKGIFGVPTFVIGDQVFWGNDRIDFVREHLREMRLARL